MMAVFSFLFGGILAAAIDPQVTAERVNQALAVCEPHGGLKLIAAPKEAHCTNGLVIALL